MNLSPLHDRVVIEKIEEEKKTSGGVIIPDTAQEKPQKGKVIAVGPGVHNDSGNVTPLTVKANDMVLFGKWSGTEVEISGKEYLIMKESDIFAIIK